MGGRRRLRSGLRPWLPDHRTAAGVAFRRYVRAALEILGLDALNGSERVRLAVEQYARAGVAFDQASRAWADLVAQRETGRGRRPSAQAVERAARRMGLADQTLKDAAARLEALRAALTPAPDPLAAVRRAVQEANRR